MAKLTFVLEDGQEIVVPLVERITLGRGEDNDVVVDDERISKRHAELVRNADGSIQLFDSDSTAGTFVNGERVRSHTISHGDSLAFGPLIAVLDLEEADGNVSEDNVSISALALSDTQVVTLNTPVQAGKIGTRKRNRGGKRELPAEEDLAWKRAEHEDTMARLGAEKAQMKSELAAVRSELSEWRERSAAEHATHLACVESLRREADRLEPIQTAVQEAEAAHADWLKSIQTFSAQQEERTTTLQRLTQDEAATRHELEGLATHRDQALAHLQQIRAESVHDEGALAELRCQLAELETRSQHSKEIADVRDDQVKTAEKKLDQLSQQRAQIEAHIHDLTGTEEKLVQARAHCHEAEAQHAALTAAIAVLGREQESATVTVKDLKARIVELQDSQQQAGTATAEALSTRQHVEKSLQQLQDELAAGAKNLAARSAEIIAETQRLEDVRTRRARLDQQCQELADTEGKLTGAKLELAAAVQRLVEEGNAITAAKAQLAEHQEVIQALSGDETAAKGRIDVLRARENDLRTELTQLGAAERTQRTRFEEVRQLAAEAEKEHAARQQQLASSIETARNELADLLSRLQPLRDWKEAMDELYARLSTLPQDSAEARDLWHEIEKEKAGLHALITTARNQAHAAAPSPGVLSQMVVKMETHREVRAGSTVAPGTTQETTLRSRLAHLRESVQREEARLEQLRLERTRRDPPHRTNLAAEAMMREQSRHLEAKIRQEQERHHALLHNIELSQMEEDKRRERLGELEHRLMELRVDIAEAERQRSELRQQADLAHAELKNFESIIDRLGKKTAD